ncbi:MAG: hypothetical protein PVI78_01185 [Anaerolineales bacterium]|jgi:hypothetical protein
MSEKHRATYLVLISSVVVMLLACNSLIADPTRTPTPPTPTATEIESDRCAEARSPSDEDVDFALAFADKVFIPDEWQRTYSVQIDRVQATYHGPEGGFASLEYVVFPCGYTSADMDDYFNRESLEQVIYANYQHPRVIANCRNDAEHTMLFEISAESQGTLYAIRHWVQTDHPTRMLNILIAYPETDSDNLDKLGEQLFPQLVSCSR